jgi:hypothetical protein
MFVMNLIYILVWKLVVLSHLWYLYYSSVFPGSCQVNTFVFIDWSFHYWCACAVRLSKCFAVVMVHVRSPTVRPLHYCKWSMCMVHLSESCTYCRWCTIYESKYCTIVMISAHSPAVQASCYCGGACAQSSCPNIALLQWHVCLVQCLNVAPF